MSTLNEMRQTPEIKAPFIHIGKGRCIITLPGILYQNEFTINEWKDFASFTEIPNNIRIPCNKIISEIELLLDKHISKNKELLELDANAIKQNFSKFFYIIIMMQFRILVMVTSRFVILNQQKKDLQNILPC